MSTRSYLSIGDVLTLLRQEFPDVTISKIRFLESQGLVNPERTPSGYRKFYEHDVERLRWVLRQQREHFLPLKVIKDRLDEDADGAVAAAPAAPATKRSAKATGTAPAPAATTTAAPAAGPKAPAPGPRSPEKVAVPTPGEPEPEPEPVLVGQRASSHRASEAGVASDPSSGLPGIDPGVTRPSASLSAPAPPVERAHRASLATQHSHTSDPPANGSGGGPGDTTASAAPAGKPTHRPARPAASAADAAPPAAGAGAATGAAETASAASGVASEPAPAAPAPAEPAPAAPAPAAPAPAAAMGSMGGASLSLDELCAASGLRAEYVGELQEYGLLRATMVGGAEYFDEEALTVAKVAAKFADFGIEARHLRLYKNAAEREAGFIEQVVIPMVRQRNPEARARASQTADDLAALGQQLKASLLRTSLRDLLNG